MIDIGTADEDNDEDDNKNETPQMDGCACRCHQALGVAAAKAGFCCGLCRAFHQSKRNGGEAKVAERNNDMTDADVLMEQVMARAPPGASAEDIKKVQAMVESVRNGTFIKEKKKRKAPKKDDETKSPKKRQKTSDQNVTMPTDEKKETKEPKAAPVTHVFKSTPKKWVTTPSETTYCIRLSDGLICQEWSSVKEGKETDFPAELHFRPTAANLKRVKTLVNLVDHSHHTCRAFAGYAMKSKSYYSTTAVTTSSKQTHIFLKFGRTPEEDLELQRREREAAEAKKQEERKAREERLSTILNLANRQYWKNADGTDSSRLRTRDIHPSKSEELMTPQALKIWLEVQKKALSEFVKTKEFADAMLIV